MRLIHDQDRELYSHFEAYEIAPALYATPWFLTLFASQFPLGFVARVFGNKAYSFKFIIVYFLVTLAVY